MRCARRLSAIVMTALCCTAVPSPAGERASRLVAAPHEAAQAPYPGNGTPIEPPRADVRSPADHAHQSQASRAHAERDKTFAWLLLLLKDRRGAR